MTNNCLNLMKKIASTINATNARSALTKYLKGNRKADQRYTKGLIDYVNPRQGADGEWIFDEADKKTGKILNKGTMKFTE